MSFYVNVTVVHRHAREIASACVSVCVCVGGGGVTLSSRVCSETVAEKERDLG